MPSNSNMAIAEKYQYIYAKGGDDDNNNEWTNYFLPSVKILRKSYN